MYDLKDPKQRARYLTIIHRRRDSFFPVTERMVQSAFKKMGTPILKAWNSGDSLSTRQKNALKAIEDNEHLMTQMIKRIWELSGSDGYRFSEEIWGTSKPEKQAKPTRQKGILSWLSHVAEAVLNTMGDKIKGITEETKRELKRVIFSGVEEQEGIPEITKRVQSVFEEMPKWRAERIARTETLNSFTQGMLSQSKEGGSKLDRIWLSSRDKKVRLAHRQMDPWWGLGGHTIPYDQEEGWNCPDGTSWPNEAPNCRCALGFTIPEESNE